MLLKPEQLAQAFTQETADLTEPFRARRTLVAAASEIMRRTGNPWPTGDFDVRKISSTLPDPSDPTRQIPNPEFDPKALLALSRPTAEAIVLLTCEEDNLIHYLEEGRQDYETQRWRHPDLDRAVNVLLARHSDAEIIAQAAGIRDVIAQAAGSAIEPVDSDSQGEPEASPRRP